MKYNVPAASVRLRGCEPSGPGRISITIAVPAVVPSLLQSSRPLLSSLAEKYKVPFNVIEEVGGLAVSLGALADPVCGLGVLRTSARRSGPSLA
jgi:hypothetical protein